jgi:anthranilate/para-aminobenzoate synthase component II
LKEIVKDKSDAMEKKAATIKIIFFPESYMSSRDRPYLDEMLQQL